MMVDELLARLEGVRTRGPNAWVARCPAHKDRSPSLAIRALADGRILLHDFAGCEVYAVLDALNLTAADLFPPRLKEHAIGGPARAFNFATDDALRVLARESWVVLLAAEDLAQGVDLTPDDRGRLLEASLRIRDAAALT